VNSGAAQGEQTIDGGEQTPPMNVERHWEMYGSVQAEASAHRNVQTALGVVVTAHARQVRPASQGFPQAAANVSQAPL
jgi:hypothetical protein